MLQKIIFISAMLMVIMGNARALNDIDKSVLRNCGDDCNGESPNCNDCYERAIELNDQSVYDTRKTPNGFEIDF